jgi:hypothetical protein
MDFGEVLTRSWRIIWKHKILWLFGILASCGQGNGNGGGSGNASYQFSGTETYLPTEFHQYLPALQRFVENIETWQILIFVSIAILISLFLSALVLSFNTIGRIGLIQGTVKADNDVEKISLGELFQNGLPFFWRVLGLNLGYGLVFALLVSIIVIPLVFISIITFGIGLLCLMPIICLLVPLSLLAGVILEQAIIALVIEDLGVITSVQRGWQVFRENLGAMIVMALILGLGGIVVSMVIVFPLFFISVPIIIAAFTGTLAEIDYALGGGILISVLLFTAYLPVMVVIGGILRAYINAAWTLTYLRLTIPTSPSETELENIPEADGLDSNQPDG